MGKVYRATDVSPHIAVKMIRDELFANQAYGKFRQESPSTALRIRM
jgi:hypothetical protein